MSKLIVNEIEKRDGSQLTITAGTDVSMGGALTVSGNLAANGGINVAEVQVGGQTLTEDMVAALATSKTLNGSQYVFVPANGTDVENAAELQAAYTTATSKVISDTVLETIPNQDYFYNYYGTFEIYIFNNREKYFPAVGFYDVVLDGVAHVMEVTSINDIVVNANIPDVYDFSELSVYLSVTFPSTVIAANGLYNFSSDFVMDTEHVNLVSLDGNRSIIFNGEGTLSVEADNLFVKGVDVQTKAFKVSDNLPNITIENCSGGNDSFGNSEETISGTFNNCTGGYSSFGGYLSVASGTFTNCVAGYQSFGAYGTASGTFTDCKAGYESFGGYGTASGTFTNCVSAEYSFGKSEASGTFTNCEGGAYSFGDGGIASGIFDNCIGYDSCFGAYGTASGIFSNCVGGYESFATVGTLSGKLFYCRLTPGSGTFNTVSGGGRTIYCIDGDDNTNNQ